MILDRDPLHNFCAELLQDLRLGHESMGTQRDDHRDLRILDPRGIHLVKHDRDDLVGRSQPRIVVGENHNFGGSFRQLP
jgi:hypothetical protein